MLLVNVPIYWGASHFNELPFFVIRQWDKYYPQYCLFHAYGQRYESISICLYLEDELADGRPRVVMVVLIVVLQQTQTK
ncbi:10100_t:CDS:2 [Paraglomus occultum]|uniref:10100_t:CDS:1 n=1 Tax=Paraglomus occultum TaxID=144539 RepID=A0A9N8YZ37_9GLOM|nr:10100_t:CDS:2 [Paraglomus occultum]